MSVLVPEPGAGLPAHRAPAYTDELHAGHTAHEPELRAALAAVGFAPRGRVLDLACGDGCHGRWLAELVGDVLGLDRSPALLARASSVGAIRLLRADAAALPFPDASLDGAWCAHSLASLPDVGAALAELRRVVRPGGLVAVLETDLVHGLILPWPPDLELAVRAAQLRALADVAAEAGRTLATFSSGRFLDRLLADAGLEPQGRRTLVIDRRPPYRPDEQALLRSLLADLRWRAAPFLARAELARLDALSGEALLAGPVTYIELVAVARVAPPRGAR